MHVALSVLSVLANSGTAAHPAAVAKSGRRPPVLLRVANAAPAVSALLRLTRLDRAYQPAALGGG